jgi:hypothetical protein
MCIVGADSENVDLAIQGVPARSVQTRLDAAGMLVSRYGLVVVLLLIGVLKFTPGEAAGI